MLNCPVIKLVFIFKIQIVLVSFLHILHIKLIIYLFLMTCHLWNITCHRIETFVELNKYFIDGRNNYTQIEPYNHLYFFQNGNSKVCCYIIILLHWNTNKIWIIRTQREVITVSREKKMITDFIKSGNMVGKVK